MGRVTNVIAFAQSNREDESRQALPAHLFRNQRLHPAFLPPQYIFTQIPILLPDNPHQYGFGRGALARNTAYSAYPLRFGADHNQCWQDQQIGGHQGQKADR
ncbi:MAG: hypothetical protein ACI8RZ_006334 [Myxococcota bacterium]|jgi:hypothetical protein